MTADELQALYDEYNEASDIVYSRRDRFNNEDMFYVYESNYGVMKHIARRLFDAIKKYRQVELTENHEDTE